MEPFQTTEELEGSIKIERYHDAFPNKNKINQRNKNRFLIILFILIFLSIHFIFGIIKLNRLKNEQFDLEDQLEKNQEKIDYLIENMNILVNNNNDLDQIIKNLTTNIESEGFSQSIFEIEIQNIKKDLKEYQDEFKKLSEELDRLKIKQKNLIYQIEESKIHGGYIGY